MDVAMTSKFSQSRYYGFRYDRCSCIPEEFWSEGISSPKFRLARDFRHRELQLSAAYQSYDVRTFSECDVTARAVEHDVSPLRMCREVNGLKYHESPVKWLKYQPRSQEPLSKVVQKITVDQYTLKPLVA